MSKAKKWEIRHPESLDAKKFTSQQLITLLLENRGLTSKKDQEAFLNPSLAMVTPKSVGIDEKDLQKTIKRIEQAIASQEQIIVFGDYDVDGITGAAILWETLHRIGAKCLPYIPNRVDEGYGLSIKGIENAQSSIPDIKLIITVDNGIVANEAVTFANEKSIDVIITDHHTIGEALPDAFSIVHTTKLCGAGVAYLLTKELIKGKDDVFEDIHLELAALGTVADLVPLTNANRAIVMAGLKKLQTTSRHGLLALYNQAGIKQEAIGVYDIGYIIGPRLNAAGRIESAMESLRLLCTKDSARATLLASKLEITNKERQQLLKAAAEHAIAGVRAEIENVDTQKKILVIGHESYQEGVIGLVAGKLVEAFYRPAIVLSIGPTKSKASARSISGFDIISFLRTHNEHFINVGGHPMAAGFTIETTKVSDFKKLIETNAAEILDDALLIRSLKIDCELPFSVINQALYTDLQKLAPFGMGNPEPVFATRKVKIANMRVMGREANHLRLYLEQDGETFEAVAFGMGALAAEMKVGDKIDVAYALDENTWNGNTKLQLKVKDINN